MSVDRGTEPTGLPRHSYLLEDSWKTFLHWWNGQSNQNSDGVKRFQQHPLLSLTADLVNATMAVVDIPSMRYIYNSPNFSEFLGVVEDEYKRDGVACIFRQIPPEDQHGLAAFGELINDYFKSLPDERKNDFQSFCDYRMRRISGEQYKVLHRDRVLRYDDQGRILELFMMASKIENVKAMDNQHLRLTDGTDNVLYKFDHRTKQLILLQNLSDRELSVVKLVAQSFSLKQIADELSISFNTVKNHSFNALRKLQVKDSIEMVNLLYMWGYI